MSQYPYFIIKIANNGQYYFTLEAENDQTVMTSETYTTKESAKAGIASVQRIVPIARIIDIT